MYPQISSNVLSDIQEYFDLVGEAVDLGPSDFTSSGCAGDALDLLKVLNRGKNAYKLLKRTKNSWLFARASHILANNFIAA
jgi:hypothetical protein